MLQRFSPLIFIAAILFSQLSVAQVPNCTAAQKNEALAASVTGATTYNLTCNLTLSVGQKITKQVQIIGSESSGLTLDCAGGSIGISTSVGDAIIVRSRKNSTVPATWSRPENVTIKNCIVFGGIRVYGMGRNGEAADVKASSVTLGHTQRAQDAAPKNITLDNLSFVANERTPVYFAPGVTYSTVANSDFSGSALSVAIYLDAESGFNTIYNNRFLDFSDPREIIAVDGSANNLIHRNIFSDTERGGIYLYRNCGEAGTVRHQTPDNNLIINNVFFGRPSVPGNGNSFSNPAVWVASRNGGKSYCGADSGYPFGSSINDNDLAKNNVVAQNEIFNYSLSAPIIFSYAPNYVISNTANIGMTPPSLISRESGCYKANGAPNSFVTDGKTWTEVFINGVAQSDGYIYHCNNALVSVERIIPPPKIVSLSASRSKITIGESVTLSWATTDATSLVIDPGAINVLSLAANSIVVRPTVTTTYQLTARNSKGTVSKSVSVVVDPIGTCVTQDTIRGGGIYENVTLSSCQTICSSFYNSAADAAYIWEGRFIYPDQHEAILTPARNPILAPSTPRGVVAAAGIASASISFLAPSTDGGAPVLEYLIYVYANGSTTANAIHRGILSTSNNLVTGLIKGQSYVFKVRARNRVGYSGYSSASSIVISK